MKKKSSILTFVIGTLVFFASCQNNVELPSNDFSETIKYRTHQEMIEQSLAAYNHLYPATSRNSREVVNIVPVRTSMSRGEVPNPLYAINFADSAGYVIIASHPNVEPVMAVIEEGSFDPNTDNDGFNAFLRAAENYLPVTYSTNDKELNIDTLKLNFQYWEEDVDTLTYLNVKPHLENWWGQDKPYNKYCPTLYDSESKSHKNCLTGCVPTALSMVMAYFQSSSSFKITYDGSNRNIWLKWNEIKRHIYTPANNIDSDIFLCTENGHDQLALIMRELGYVCNTQYGLNESLTDAQMIPKGLEAIGIKNAECRNYYTVKGAIDNETILLMQGGGHCFIIDGADCIWFKYTLRLYQEDSFGFRTLISTEYSESRHDYAHVVWGYDNLAVGYFNDGVLKMMKPYRLDSGAIPTTNPADFSSNMKYYPLKLTLTITPTDPVPVI